MASDNLSTAHTAQIANSILAHVQPGSIIVLHDGMSLQHDGNREDTVQALPIIIHALKAKGYRFITL